MLIRSNVIYFNVFIGITLISVVVSDELAGNDPVNTLLEGASEIIENENGINAFQRVTAIMEKVRNLQHSTPFLEEPEQNRMSHIVQLQQYCSSRFSGVRLEDFEGEGFGLRATEDIPRNKLINAIPVNETLNYIEALEHFKHLPELSDVVGFADEDHDRWQTGVWLTIYLMSEQQNDLSKHKVAINALPRKFLHPLLFGYEQVDLLEGGQATDGLLVRYSIMIENYISLYTFFHDNPDGARSVGLSTSTFTFQFYQWAFTSVITRCYEDEHNMLVIPCFDMINHAFPSNADTDVSYDLTKQPAGIEGDAYLWATRDIRKGEELSYYYQPRTETLDHFFNVWGIPETNASLLLQTKLDNDTPNLKQKIQFLRDLGLANQPRNLIEFELDLEEPLLVRNKSFPVLVVISSNVTPQETISQQAWIKLWKYLVILIDRQIRGYKYSQLDCEQILTRSDLNGQTYLAATQTLNEQRFLEKAKQKAAILSQTRVVTVKWEKHHAEPLRQRNRLQKLRTPKTVSIKKKNEL